MSEDTPDILPEVTDTPSEPESPTEVYTVKDYLQGVSALLSEDALRMILAKRHLSPDTPIEDLAEKELDLAEAEVYYQLSNLPVGGATQKDVDGSWSHTEGGWTVSGENIKQWRQKYIDLREKWGEKVLTKSTIRVHARGMRVWRRR
jgi:DNA-binding transcriptional ArsR family regulator